MNLCGNFRFETLRSVEEILFSFQHQFSPTYPTGIIAEVQVIEPCCLMGVAEVEVGSALCHDLFLHEPTQRIGYGKPQLTLHNEVRW